jgi:hypothetical protein
VRWPVQPVVKKIGHDGQSPVLLPGDAYTTEQWDTYFGHLEQGVGPDLAARDLGTTGSRIKTLIKRDPDYQARFEAAREAGNQHYEDRLRAQARLKALDPTGGSDRILEVELATHVDDYAHLRRDRVKHTVEGRIEHGLTIVLDIAALENRPEDAARARAALETLRELGVGDVIDSDVGT